MNSSAIKSMSERMGRNVHFYEDTTSYSEHAYFLLGDSYCRNIDTTNTTNPTREEMPITWVWQPGAKDEQFLEILKDLLDKLFNDRKFRRFSP